MTAPLVMLALFAASEPVRVACPGLTSVGLKAGQGEAFSEHLATQLQLQSSVKISTQKEIAAVLGVERQKQLLGCTEGSAECMAELAGAIGADALLLGNLTAVGDGFLVTLKLVSTKDAQSFAVVSQRVGDSTALIELLDATAASFAEKLRERYGVAATGEPPPSMLKQKWWVGALGGVIIASVGGTLSAFAFLGVQQIITGEGDWKGATYARASVGVDQAILQQYIGFVVMGVGAAVLLASIVLRLVL